FGAMAIFVQAPLVGVPNDPTLGLDTLLFGLAAAMVARMERISVALLAGMGIGVFYFGSIEKEGDNNLASALMLVIILLALLFQRGAMSRAYDTGVSTWQAVKHFRPIPTELRNVREVVVARGVLYALTAVIVVGAPYALRKPDLNQLIVLPIFGIV